MVALPGPDLTMATALLKPRKAKRFPLEQLAWTGSRDAKDPTAAGPRKAYLAKNVYPEAPEIGTALIGRPGIYRLGGQIGTGGQVQWVGQFTNQAGTVDKTLAFVGGELWTYNWTTDAWTKIYTNAQLITNGGGDGLSTTALIYALNHADKLVYHDGVTKPWAYDGAAFPSYLGASGWSVLSGPMVEYYAKLFGVKAASPTILWSEENDTATVAANAWDLIQTDTNRLRGLAATNEALYYFRDRSIGMVSGAVNTDFSSSGTQEAISDAIGTRSPAAIRVYGTAVHFIDSDGRPRRIVAGAGLTEADVSLDALGSAASALAAYLANAQSAVWTAGRLSLHAFCASGTHLTTIYALSQTGEFVGLWAVTGFSFDVMGQVKNASNQPFVVFGTNDGYVYALDLPTGTHWSDELAGGTVAISHDIEGGPLGYDTRQQKGFDDITLSLRAQGTSNISGASLTYTTPGGTSSPLALPTLTYADTEEKKITVGLDGLGRWIRPRIVHATAGERFALLGWRVSAYDAGDDPQAA